MTGKLPRRGLWEDGVVELDHSFTSPTHRLLPTPNAGVFNDSEPLDSWLARRERLRARRDNGNGMGTPLNVAVRLLAEGRTADPPTR